MTDSLERELAARILARAASMPRAGRCAHCGAETTLRGRGRYCSPGCRQAAWRIRHRK